MKKINRHFGIFSSCSQKITFDVSLQISCGLHEMSKPFSGKYKNVNTSLSFAEFVPGVLKVNLI